MPEVRARSCCIFVEDLVDGACDVMASAEDVLHSQGKASVPMRCEAMMWNFSIVIEAAIGGRCRDPVAGKALHSGGSDGDALD
ncbi:hypothetical protein NDU88_005498 [Pleurodeles waltl]|uniref:Uncharacterized protein n=1 Tax=Pleurodeles waltl TaxID=8319 RepID=A0AAV7WB67_PLEWA|nr:hypothetical protein NDU88_005498 [Pleurodeles waltl]